MKWQKVLFLMGWSFLSFNPGCAIEEPLDFSDTPMDEPFPSRSLTSPSPRFPPIFEQNEIYQTARRVTVKVLSGQTWGSGIIIQQRGNRYMVVTNRHVMIYGEPQQNYRIVTPDGQVHPANVLKNVNFRDQDLALVTFTSPLSYSVASLFVSSQPQRGEPVFAAGFPVEDDGDSRGQFVLNPGIISQWSPKPFAGGYQIGYTSTVRKGMSGGALFNQFGEIIGINGIHKYPLWGNPYVFTDGTRASLTEKQEMSQYSWAIPLETLLKSLNTIINN